MERSSDNGEPAGTAGPPILGAIKGERLLDRLCVVVRYFGGIKLGARGLMRAYGGAARLVLRSARAVVRPPRVAIRLSTAAANVGAVYAAAARRDGAVTSGEAYDDRGGLELTITCDKEDAVRLMEDIVDAIRGGVTFM
jgi:putative IMPACT (imprinted ancient) family translation regulator